MAKNIGIVFQKRTGDLIELLVFGETVQFKVLNVLEFTSARRRMSVIVKNEKNEILIMTKGADSVIYERLAPGQDDLVKQLANHASQFATEGLRTLCLGQRKLTATEYDEWQSEYKAAALSIGDGEERILALNDKIENNLLILGVTAVEDKLQDGVGQTIDKLREAGIKIWVLTGDKMETAISIGFASNLFQFGSDLIKILGPSSEEISQQLFKIVQDSENNSSLMHLSDKRNLVIDGGCLQHVMASGELQQLFLKIATKCKSVLCCRVSAKQKAEVVRLVKSKLDATCLAIGDGANDVR